MLSRCPRSYAEGRREERGTGILDEPFTPTKLTGLRLLLEASRITGLVNNDPISQWDDASGLGNHVTSSAGNRPLYKTSGMNGLPAVAFDGSDDWFLVPSLFGSATPLTVYAVITPAGSGSRRLLDVQTGRLYVFYRSSGTGQSGVFNNGADRDCVAASAVAQKLSIVCSAAGGIKFRRNGTDIPNAHAYVETALGGTIRIGSHYDGGSSRYQGDISLLAVCAAAHVQAEIDAMEAYSLATYGV